MNFAFKTANHIIFGNKKSGMIPEICSRSGHRILFVTGKRDSYIKAFGPDFQKYGIPVVPFHVTTEPTVELIEEGLRLSRQEKCDCVVAVGGGSVIDTAKALAVLISNKGTLVEYLEVIGEAKPLRIPGVPMIAVPTTAGTGAEATSNAVIASGEYKVKVSLRSDFLFPLYAVVDPVLTCSLEKDITAMTGFDALTQLIESYISRMSSPITDSLCLEGLKRIKTSFLPAYENGNNLQAREDMCVASLFSGIALANSKLGAVHGIAGPLGGMTGAPHGGICAALLAPVMKKNIIRAREEQIESTLFKLNILEQLFTGQSTKDFSALLSWIETLGTMMGIRRLGESGFNQEMFQMLAEKALQASSMKGNPVNLKEEDLLDIFSVIL